MKKKNLSFQLSIYFLISETILSVFIIFIGYNYVRDSLLENYRFRLQYDVQEVLDEVKNMMDEAVRFSENLQSDIVQGHLQKNPQEYIEMVFKGQSNMYAFGMVTSVTNSRKQQKSDFTLIRSGSMIRSDTGRFSSKNSEQNDWINRMLYSSKPEWSHPFFNPETGTRSITHALPFDYPKDGKLVHSTFFCTVSLDPNFRSLKDQEMMKSGFSVILDEQNRFVYHPDSTKTGQKVSSLSGYLGNSQFDITKLLTNRVPGYQIIYSDNNHSISKVAIYWPVKSSKWFIVTLFPEYLFTSELKQVTLALILLIFFIGGITTAVTIYLSFRLVSPITVLADDSRKIMEDADFDPFNSGNFLGRGKRYPVTRLNDLEVLSGNMDKMKEWLAIYRKNSLQNSIDKVEMNKELMLARDIEMSMVPTKFPLFPGRNDFNCFGKLIPAKIVGGDLFDIFLINENHLFISISDTLGKGIPAAMFSVITRTFIRSIANPITRLGKIMESLNDELSLGLESDMFATVLLGKLNLITGEFIYCNAGHPHPFILRNDHREEVLTQSHGIPVGVKSNLRFSESRTVLAPGESLITFTDGVTEEYNENGEFFGSERLISVVKPFYELSTQSIVNKTLEVLERFRGRAEAHDDATLVAIKFTGK